MTAEYDHFFMVKAAGPLQGVIYDDHRIPDRPCERIPIANDHAPRRLDHPTPLVNQVHDAAEWDATLEQPPTDLGAATRIVPEVAEAQLLIGSRDHTPALADADRALLSNTLRGLRRAINDRGAAEQLLHGEPHPGNLLRTKKGLLFIDFETCCRGPVEFDIAHVPGEVGARYPGADQELLRECRILMLAMVASWRWDRNDQFPNGLRMGAEFLSRIRTALDRSGSDASP